MEDLQDAQMIIIDTAELQEKISQIYTILEETGLPNEALIGILENIKYTLLVGDEE